MSFLMQRLTFITFLRTSIHKHFQTFKLSNLRSGATNFVNFLGLWLTAKSYEFYIFAEE